jgi:hypothetical protein
VGDLGHKRVVGVGVCEHGADRKEDWTGRQVSGMLRIVDGWRDMGWLGHTFRDGQRRTPLIPEDI